MTQSQRLLVLWLSVSHVGFACEVRSQPGLVPLLENERGALIKSKREWSRERKQISKKWRDVLGPLPRTKPPLKSEFLAREELPGFIRQLVSYQVQPGVRVDGYLLTPGNRIGKLPAVVVFHPTTPVHAKGVAGVASDYSEEKQHGVQLVQRGYVVWCPRNYIFADGADWKTNTQKLLAQHPEWTGMTRMLWDAIRAADFLESLPYVDPKRFGCLGHSLGAKEVLYALAFDKRYKTGVFSEGGIGLKFSNWEDVWYLGPQVRAPGFPLEHHQLLALIAPRAFLLLAGDSADGEASAGFVHAVRPVYDLLGASENLVFFNHHQGHSYPQEARSSA
jgi:hypothetical protein